MVYGGFPADIIVQIIAQFSQSYHNSHSYQRVKIAHPFSRYLRPCGFLFAEMRFSEALVMPNLTQLTVVSIRRGEVIKDRLPTPYSGIPLLIV